MQATCAAPFCVGEGDDPPAVTHEWNRLAHPDEERLRLGIERRVPLVQRDLQGRLEEGGHLGPRVAHEDVELLELRLHLAKHLLDLFGARHVGLHDESVRIPLANLGKRIVGGALVLVIVDGDLHSLLRQLQRNSSTNATRASGDQSVFRIRRHMDLLIDLRLTPHKFARQAQPARSTPRVFGGDEKLTTALLDRLAEHAPPRSLQSIRPTIPATQSQPIQSPSRAASGTTARRGTSATKTASLPVGVTALVWMRP